MQTLGRHSSQRDPGAPTVMQISTLQTLALAHARKCVILLEMEPGPRRDFVAFALQSGGATVIATVTGQPLDNIDAVFASQVVVLDGASSGYDGSAICQTLVQMKGPPVVLLAASDEENERIRGLESGADDCLPASTSARELLARVFALARRGSLTRAPETTQPTSRYHFCGWTFCPGSGELKGPTGRTGFLPRAEHGLFKIFVEHARQVLSVDRLADLIGSEPPSDVTGKVDWRVRISRLRRRLQRLDNGADLIRTVQGQGYIFIAECAVDPA